MVGINWFCLFKLYNFLNAVVWIIVFGKFNNIEVLSVVNFEGDISWMVFLVFFCFFLFLFLLVYLVKNFINKI